jgi:hypothetical protein
MGFLGGLCHDSASTLSVSRSADYIKCFDTAVLMGCLQSETVRKLKAAFVPAMMSADQVRSGHPHTLYPQLMS